MAVPVKIFLGIGLLVAVYFMARSFVDRKVDKVAESIVSYLESQEAFNPLMAVELTWQKHVNDGQFLAFLFDRALIDMLEDGIIVKTNQGRYFIRTRGITR